MLHSKKDYQDCLMNIMQPLIPYYTPGSAGVKCGATGANYGEATARMEGFARGLWGLAPFWGGQGEQKAFEDIYIKGIRNGTDPEHEEYWGKMKDHDQRIVETAALGLALILAPHKIWTPLNDAEREHLFVWLSQVNEVKPANNNWQFFPIIVNLGLKNVGMPYRADVVEKAWETIDSFYKGNGWYADGEAERYDYYIPFAMHFYGLIYAKVMEKEDEKRSNVLKERATRFAQDFIYWFAEDGSALAFGRSMTYRFAQCCFWSACVFAGIEPFPLGVMKGIIQRNLEWWLSKPIFDNGGVLTIGYAYPNLCMSEGYNAFGSAYWALKAFLILALDDDHAFFKTESLPLPKLDSLHIIPEAKMVIQRLDGNVIAITAGQWVPFKPIHVAEKYSKFVYSSRYAFCVPRSYYGLPYAGTDSMLTFVKEDICFVRRKCQEVRIEENGTVFSKWSPCEGVQVQTWIIPTEDGHIRKHTIFCEKDCVAYDCSFAVPADLPHTENSNTGSVSGSGETVLIKCKPNMNLMNPETVIKAVKYALHQGYNEIETTVIYPREQQKIL